MANFFSHWSYTECGPWSYKVPAPYGLPQSSILGPLLYIIYTSGLSTLLAETGAQCQLYADDIQAYIHCRPANASLVIGEMGHVLGKLETWMSSNRLSLNPAKTKFMWLRICFLILSSAVTTADFISGDTSESMNAKPRRISLKHSLKISLKHHKFSENDLIATYATDSFVF